MIYEVPLKNITRENFSSFGKYFNEKGTIPTFSDAGFDWWNEIGLADIPGKLSFGIVRPKYNPEFSEKSFEQHKHTPEILIPVDEDVIVLAGRRNAFIEEMPKPEDFEAFLVPRGTIVSLDAGVWHHAPMVKGASSRVVVIFKEKTSSDDNTMKDLSQMDLIIKVNTVS
jgi:ureidoglycolate lyase